MDFILGATIPLLVIYLLNKWILPYHQSKQIKISYRQSDIYETIRPALPILNDLAPRPETQASKHEARNMIKVLMYENQAYWIKDNSVFVADIVNGDVDRAAARVVDTMAMDKVQLDRLSFIIDKLTKGDSGDSSYPRFS